MRAAVLGRPIAHSLSPTLHRAAYVELGLDWSYEAIECGEAELPALLADSGPEWIGFSCTMPLKRALLTVATAVGDTARAAGAANTLIRAVDGWRAENTDVPGIVRALQERRVEPRTVTVLGAGGTAQAAVVALAELGVASCAVLVRDPARAGELLATASAVGVTAELGALVPGAPHLAADLVISTLPRRAADPLAPYSWSSGQALLDAVYDPWPTALAAAVSGAGAVVVSGALMLLHQAAAQVELMTGRRAPVEAMRAALRSAVPAAGL